jgi:hypothetical protein
MSQYRNLTNQQESFLVKCLEVINTWTERNQSYYYLQWELELEMKFIRNVLNDRVYDLFYDSDRLNSLGSLYRYLKKELR